MGVQTVLLLLGNAAGYFLHPFGVRQSFTNSSVVTLTDGQYIHTQTFTFLWDGAIVMAGVYVLILVVQAVRGRMPAAAVESTVALALAAAIGLWDGLEYLAGAALRR